MFECHIQLKREAQPLL